MNKQTILFIGIGRDQLPVIREAIDLGLGILGIDGNPKAAGAEFCDYFECVDIMNPDAVEDVALRLNKKFGIDGAMCPAVEAGISTGKVIDRLGLIGIGEKTAIDLTDKIRRRYRLDELKISQPRWAIREEKKSGLWDIFPCVVKPRDKSAAQGVRLAKNMGEIGLNYDLVEAYLEGWEISTEILVFPDKSFVSISADRNYDKKLKYAPYLLEDGCSLPSRLPQAMLRKIDILIQRIIDGLNLRSCAIKLDLLVKDNIVYVIEVAPRLGGGKLSSVMIPVYCGLNWWRGALQLAMGMPLNIGTPFKEVVPTAQRYHFLPNPQSHRDRDQDFIETGATIEEAIAKAEEKVNLKC